jgi:beta-N-acetylhexosaminidase
MRVGADASMRTGAIIMAGHMSVRELRRHVGRLAIVGFRGHSVPDDLRALVADFDLGGVIYFARNVGEPRQVAELSREVAALARDWPLWISVDQEGGRVARLEAPFTEWPPLATLGRSGDIDLARRFAAALAAELAAVGINLDYAPVLDVRTNPANVVIGDRALSDRPDEVARLGTALVETLQAAGVAACGKHFPGHGDTRGDSHEELPVLDHDRRRLEAIELQPFRQAIAAEVASIMVAHLALPAIDPERPASLAPAVIQTLLKHALGFPGVVVSDDLGMKAVTDSRSLEVAAVDALVAGCDAVLLCNSSIDDQVRALEAVIRAAESQQLSRTRIDDAMGRQQRMKARFLAEPPAARDLAVIGCDAHRAVADEMGAWQ